MTFVGRETDRYHKKCDADHIDEQIKKGRLPIGNHPYIRT
jgi:hypothetical protein